MSPQNINLDETVPARVLPFQNAVSFTDQPGELGEFINSDPHSGLKFGAWNFAPRPSGVPAHATAFKFNGLWFWVWN